MRITLRIWKNYSRDLTEFGRIRSVSGVKAGSWRGLVNSTLVYAFQFELHAYGMHVRCCAPRANYIEQTQARSGWWRRGGWRGHRLSRLIVPVRPVMSCVVVRIFTADFEELFVSLRIFTADFEELFSKKCVIYSADLQQLKLRKKTDDRTDHQTGTCE